MSWGDAGADGPSPRCHGHLSPCTFPWTRSTGSLAGDAAETSGSGTHREPDLYDSQTNERIHHRQTVSDHDVLEKERLSQRRGGHFRYQGSINPVIPPTTSLGYADERDRLSRKNLAMEEHERRVQTLERRAAALDARRAATMAREESRWATMDRQFERTVAREREKRDSGQGAKRNAGSVGYDPITLQYKDSLDGLRLKYKDDTTRYRAAVRADMLYQKQHHELVNVITGEKIAPRVHVPEKPLLPEELSLSGRL